VNPLSQDSKLTQLGIDATSVSDEQRAALGELSAEEVAVLASVKQRFDDAGGDVEGHITDDKGSVFW
jgi:hypothetical protein